MGRGGGDQRGSGKVKASLASRPNRWVHTALVCLLRRRDQQKDCKICALYGGMEAKGR